MDPFDSPEFFEEMERQAMAVMAEQKQKQEIVEAKATAAAAMPATNSSGLPTDFFAEVRSSMKSEYVPVSTSYAVTNSPIKVAPTPSLPPPPTATTTTSHWTDASSSSSSSSNSSRDTLKKVFGFDYFREGQEEVVERTLRGQDTAVFWATGMGKSICYQIPALHSGKTAIIISPLISLMQDQCTKLNSLAAYSEHRRQVATFLGSGQTDGSMDMRALNGEFLLVYCTPEKIASDSFMDSLALLNSGRGLSLMAIDEAHWYVKLFEIHI